MGTFIGHLVPGLAFTLLGLWHALNTIKSYKHQGPAANFTCTTWFPFPKIKHLELYLIFSFSLLSIAFQFSDNHWPHLGLAGLEHATMFIHLLIYAAAALAADMITASDALSPLVGILAASAFGQELFLVHFHSTDHVGLEGHYHWLLQLVVVACFAAAAISSVRMSFVAAMVRSAAVTCQGVWFVVMGFALWVPRLVPEGCYYHSVGGRGGGGGGGGGGAVRCWTEGGRRRAVALANLQFSWMIAGVSVLMVGLSVWQDSKWILEYRELKYCGRRRGDGGGSLHEGDDGVILDCKSVPC